MKLTVGNICINDIQFGTATKVENNTLFVCKEEVLALLQEDARLQSVTLDLVKPGEETRIMPVKDVIEPRCKVEGTGGIFPGVVSNVETVGNGRTHVLKGSAVITTGKIVGFQEGIIDMSGPGADYTPFSKLNSLVLICEPKEGITRYEHEEAVRMAGLKTANFLGEAGKTVKPTEESTYEIAPITESSAKFPNLPKVADVYMLQSQGLLHDTYVYGVDVKVMLPTLLSPTEVFDGAITSGNCVSACDKNTSYHHLNSPVITDLLARHGKDINFVGVIVTNENVTLKDKERSSNYTAKLVDMLGLDGVIISEEGFGNPDADLIMNCTKIEKLGVKTVLITDEYAGRDGASQSLADVSPIANAVVTGGNANATIVLPPMKKIIGDVMQADWIAGGFDGSLREDGSIMVEIQAITGATNELGFNKLSAETL